MRVAVIGSRGLSVEDLAAYLPADTAVIISGGAKGIDACAREYALAHGIAYIELLPDYRRYGRGAPLKRNEEIISSADLVIAFWDGKSRGTQYTIALCQQKKLPLQVYRFTPEP